MTLTVTLTVTLTLTLNLLKPNLAAELVGGDEVLGALGADPLLHELLHVRRPATLRGTFATWLGLGLGSGSAKGSGSG